ncbi:uncharacterized protein LOC132716397 [Ruditapes philippinarum]|uniref:uncharacterized protein LOC132716397 n=1 Tax=Ruditapes philippinarum TaxID=129788 RepID=UPI00295B933F|nr:uncharacterized protein LOC132716397 [Ruditapes philippinarum]
MSACVLNKKQRAAVDFVLSGHNLVILGKAGTGKSLTVKSIYERCVSTGKQCVVTATTGIACSVYPKSMNAMTIHRWSGIGDGRYSPSEINIVVSNNPKYRQVKDRIFKTDVLIIDEFSKLDKRAMNCLNAVCSLKNALLYFGGIQVVLVGDLVQLPPVPCARYNEDGSFCFESDIYEMAFPHRIKLQQVHRQTEPQLIKAIEEASTGILTNETTKYIKKLSVLLENSDDKTRNRDEKIYIKREKFEVFEPRRNTVVATREQYPLKPAYALTIHKSQGMTLDRIEVDRRDIFKAGQLGVAIGRVRLSAGLRVVNFTDRTCRKQPEKVLRYNDECDNLSTKTKYAVLALKGNFVINKVHI